MPLKFGVRQHERINALPEINLPQVQGPRVCPAHDCAVLSDSWLNINAARETCAVSCSLDGFCFGNRVAHHALELDGHFNICVWAPINT